MLIVLIIIGLGIFGTMIFLAISKKTSFKIRIAALIALGIMVLAIIGSLVLIFTGGVVVSDSRILPDADTPVTPPRTAGNSFLIFGFILFLIALFVVVLLLSLRESRMKKHN